MIYITGDTHGNIDFNKLKRYFSNRYVTENDYLIILGDAGIVWSEEECFLYDYSSIGPTILFIDGNHENFELLNRFPLVEYKGAKCHKLYKNIYHILRGEIININGLSFFCMGGATSIDKIMRINRISWWEEENITNSDIQNGLNNLEKVNYQVDYVLSHCGPTNIIKRMFGYLGDNNTKALDGFQKVINFKYWYFGHYHNNKKWGKYRCFYYDILELPVMDTMKKEINNFVLYSDDDGNLFNRETGKRISMKVNDLPEWYFEGYCGIYFSLKDVTDVAFTRSLTDNHLDKDASVYLHYHGKLKKNKFYEPLEKEKWDYCSWRDSCKRICLGIEKYSPHLKLNKLKAAINLNYDHYNQCHELVDFSSFNIVSRPFPYVNTPHYVDTFSFKKAKYVVLEGNKILSEFLEFEYSLKYVYIYLQEKLNIKDWKEIIGNKESSTIRTFNTGSNLAKWIYIKKIDYED